MRVGHTMTHNDRNLGIVAGVKFALASVAVVAGAAHYAAMPAPIALAQPAGCYNDAGVLVAPSPCYIVPNDDGTADVYTTEPTTDAAPAVSSVAVSLVSLSSSLPPCDYEDGNEDGRPCSWVDPDSGSGYYVDSRNYR